jgi:cell division protein FtsB
MLPAPMDLLERGRGWIVAQEGPVARRTKAAGMAAAHSIRRAPSRVRWDRVGRWALLLVFVLVLYLYVGPARSWISAYAEAKEKRREVAALKAENQRLRERRADLRRPAALEREARRLGMVKAGEKPYVIEGLPRER